MVAAASVPQAIPSLARAVPTPPSSVDHFLDAAVRCFSRHGVRRTSVQDIAREAGVERTTVYRQVGNVPSILRLLAGREVHRMLDALPERLTDPHDPEAVVDLLAAVVAFGRDHPVLTKVLADEPELIGPFIVSDLPFMIDVVAAGASGLLAQAMDAGELARRDPEALAQMLVRICIPLLLAPPPGDVRHLLAEVLLPALTPEPKKS